VKEEEVKRLRIKLGLTQRSLAIKLGVETKSVSSWEQGRHVPRPRLVAKMRRLEKRHNGTSKSGGDTNG